MVTNKQFYENKYIKSNIRKFDSYKKKGIILGQATFKTKAKALKMIRSPAAKKYKGLRVVQLNRVDGSKVYVVGRKYK